MVLCINPIVTDHFKVSVRDMYNQAFDKVNGGDAFGYSFMVFMARNFEYTRKPLEFSNTEAGFLTFKAWMEDIAEKHGKTAVIPGMEPTGHYWFALGKFLQDIGMKPVHVNPHHVKKSKELDDNNPNKNDRKDPKTIAALVNEGRFSYPYIPTGIYAEVRSLSNLRLQTQEELTRVKNRIARLNTKTFTRI